MKRIVCIGIMLVSGFGLLAQTVGTAQGRVVDSNGKGLADVQLKFTYVDESIPFDKTIETKKRGDFTLTGLQPIEVQIYCSKEGYRDEIFRYKQPLGKHLLEIKMLTVEEAMELMEEEMDPKEVAKQFYNGAVPLYNQKDYDGALAELAKALEKDPELDVALRTATWCHVQLQQWEQAKATCNKYLELKPDDADMVELLKEIDLQSQGISRNSLFKEAIDALNELDDETASEKLLKLTEVAPDFGKSYFYLGRINVRAGEFEQAVAYFKKYLELAEPDDKDIAEAKELIATLE